MFFKRSSCFLNVIDIIFSKSILGYDSNIFSPILLIIPKFCKIDFGILSYSDNLLNKFDLIYNLIYKLSLDIFFTSLISKIL